MCVLHVNTLMNCPTQFLLTSVICSPAQVLEEGSWSEGVESGLTSLGCHVIDAAALGSEASAPQACGCVFPATGCGVLSALRQGAGTAGASRLSPAERDQLRAFLLQVRVRLRPAGPACSRICAG